MRPESRNRMARAWRARFFLLPIALWPVALARGLDSVSPAGPAQAERGPSDRETPQSREAAQAARDATFVSPGWRETIDAFDGWLSSQPIYSHEAVEQFKLERARRLAAMSTEELNQFARELDEKLSLVSSPECEETIEWIRETLSVATPAYARRLNLRYPDVLRLTPAQLRRELKSLERRHVAARRQAQAFERLRDERMALHQRELQAQAESRERALDRAAMSNRFAAYHPAHTATQRTRRPFYPPLTPFAFGFGLGFGFW